VKFRNGRKIEVSSSLESVRSLLFLPASNPRAIVHARESAADLVILDLEDSVKPGDKGGARSAALEAVAGEWPMPVAIRVNGIGSEWHSLDVDAVARSDADFAILPRASSAHLVREAGEALNKPLMAMVETASGVLAASDIAHESAALIAGTNDLAADLRLPAGAGREPLQTALQTIVLAARAACIPVFDGVYNDLEDPDGFVSECDEGRSLGFDGKTVIHPKQVGTCNRAFSPTQEEVGRARRLIEAYGGGAERFEGQMIERMHVAAAGRLLRRAGEGQ
jgi:citrate lyase beta subunit